MDFFLVMTKNRKKFDKYIKINKIKNKMIIDISRMIEDENLDIKKKEELAYLKVMINKMIRLAAEKKKTLYYIPLVREELNVTRLVEQLKKIKYINEFNLLFFHNDFKDDPMKDEIFEKFDAFNLTIALEDF